MSQNILQTIQKEFNGINNAKTSKSDYAKDAAEAFVREMRRKRALEASRVTMQEPVVNPLELKREIEEDYDMGLRPTAGDVNMGRQAMEDNQIQR